MTTMNETEINRRSTPRRRVSKAGKIAFGDFVFVRDCSLRDVGATGARVRVPASHEIPDEFHLILTGDRLMHKARVVWRSKGELGVEFKGPPQNLMHDPDPRLKQFQYI